MKTDDTAEPVTDRIPLNEFSAKLSSDGQKAVIALNGQAIALSSEQAFRLAITLQHIAAAARGNGG